MERIEYDNEHLSHDRVVVTSIPLNDDTRSKIADIVDEIGDGLKDAGIPGSHAYVHGLIRKRFPSIGRTDYQNMFAIYASLMCDMSIVKKWEEMYDQFDVGTGHFVYGRYAGEPLSTCICQQNTLNYIYTAINQITGAEIHVGSTCITTYCIANMSDVKKRTANENLKWAKEKAAERRKKIDLSIALGFKSESEYDADIVKKEKERHDRIVAEMKKAKEEEERIKKDKFHCCRKCKQYVIPKGTFTSTTCQDCRNYREGYKKCSCCGLYRIKKDQPYYKCFECNKSKKKISN
jgi:hypothetical protein